MSPDNPKQTSDRSSAILKRMDEVRLSSAADQVDVRKEKLLAALKESVAGLPRQDSDRVLSRLRDDLIGEARDRDRTIRELRERVRRLEGENAELQAEWDRALSTSAPDTAPLSAEDDVSPRIRNALRKINSGESVSTKSVGLSEQYVRFFRLLRALLEYVLSAHEMRVRLLHTLGVGPFRVMGTVLLDEFLAEFRAEIAACIDDRDGSVKNLQQSLTQLTDFPFQLNEAHLAADTAGAVAMLADIEPDAIQEQHTPRFGGARWEDAFKELGRKVDELRKMSGDDVWRNFFAAPLRANLDRHADADN